MKIQVKKVDGLVLPSKANELDAGYDIIATSDPVIMAEKDEILAGQILEDKPTFYRRVAYVEYETNLYWTPEIEFHVEIFPRSSISKYNLVLANSVGTVDTGYKNMVKCRFKYIFQPSDLIPHRNQNDSYELVATVNQKYLYQKGDKIAQIKPRLNEPIVFEFVDELPAVDSRGLGGFGSSDKVI